MFDFTQIDGFSATVALVGYIVVFAALVLLYMVFYKMPSILKFDFRGILHKGRMKPEADKDTDLRVTGEVNAAIGMALFLYLNKMHDEESGVITIKKISKRYSPWSSKIYGLRQNPRH